MLGALPARHASTFQQPYQREEEQASQPALYEGIRVNKALDAMADIIDIRFLCPTGIIQPTGWGYLRRQAVSPVALNVTDNQAVAVIREKKIINTEITVNNTEGMEMFESLDQVENPGLIDCNGAKFVSPKNWGTCLEYIEY